MTNDVFTLDENNNAAIRTLSVNGVAETNSPSVFTEDENGNACIRVTGGGGDSHNLGYFDTLQDLQTAYPTGEAGDWAIVAESDTVYIWDETQQAWVDTDRKGQVTSVNNQTGAVTVQETLVSGTNIKTINNTSLLGAGDLTIDSLPSQSGNTGKFLTTDGSSASWANVDALPTQTGQNGKFLTTNGSTAGWADVDSLPSQTGNAGKVLFTNGTVARWDTPTTITMRTWGANE